MHVFVREMKNALFITDMATTLVGMKSSAHFAQSGKVATQLVSAVEQEPAKGCSVQKLGEAEAFCAASFNFHTRIDIRLLQAMRFFVHCTSVEPSTAEERETLTFRTPAFWIDMM